MISVIVPVYQVAQYLSRCVDSLLNQTVRDFELILVDDGSTDGSGELCDRYAAQDSRIRVIHKPNGGLSSARNAGMDIAGGAYYLFCDSDDYVEPDWIEGFLPYLSQAQDTFVFCGFLLETEEKPQPAAETEMVFRGGLSDFLRFFARNRAGFAWNVLYSAEVIRRNRIRFDTQVIIEDLPFNLIYLESMKGILYTGHQDYHYVQYSTGTLSRVYHQDCFRKWRERYSRVMHFVDTCIPQEQADADRRFVAGVYLVSFLSVLGQVFDPRSHLTFLQKLRYNQQVVASEEFQSCLRWADCSRENPVMIAMLKHKCYYAAFLYQKLADWKRRLLKR